VDIVEKIRLSLAVAALTAAATLFSPAHAIPSVSVTTGGLSPSIDSSSNIVAQAQNVRSGSRYCWPDNGWNGSGWYRCGYAERHGQGWGGPVR